MDLATLQLVYAAILLACAGSLIITWRQNPTAVGPRSWAIGATLGALVLVVYAFSDGDPRLLWVNALGDLLAWLSMGLYALGTRQHVGLRIPRWWPPALAATALAMFTAMALTPHGRAATIIASSLVFGAFCFDLVTSALRRPETRRAPSWFIAFFFGIFGVTHFVRAILTCLELDRPVYDRPIEQAVLFVGILGAAATAMGFAMLVTERVILERAERVRRLEEAVDDLRRQFEGLAAGDYTVRAKPRGSSEPMDVLAHLFNHTAAEVEVAFAQIERQRSVLAATLESMLDGLLLLDPNGTIVNANPAAAALLAREGERLVGRPLRAIVHEADAAFADSLLAAMTSGPLREQPVTFDTASGALTLTVNASVHRGGGGEVQGVVLVLRDDRDLRAAQAQLQMTDRLTAMGTIAAGVAHEINNPLAFVISNIDFAVEELREGTPLTAERVDEIVEALEASQRGGERVRQIVRDLKTLSRSESDSEGRVDVNGLVASAVSMLENEIRHAARLELELGEVLEVQATEAKLGQVFLNLIQNAAQAIPPGHAQQNTIRVRSGTTADARVFVEVSDTGPGIAPENLQRIFDAFFTTKPVGVGTGLGLAISHRAVTSVGGTLDVQSEPGHGACFRVVLPAAESVEPR